MTHTHRRKANKHDGYDHHSAGNHHTSKKHGFGSYNWGKPGAEMDDVPVLDKGDPMYDEEQGHVPRSKSRTSSTSSTDSNPSPKVRVVSK